MSPRKRSAKEARRLAEKRSVRRATAHNGHNQPTPSQGLIPAPLFKYTQREYAERMVSDGTIKIGTLFGFRNAELGPAIGDSHEGFAETHHDVSGTIDISNPANRSWVMDRVFNVAPGVKNVTVTDVSLVVKHPSDDLYLYCLTYEYSQQTMRAFNADACVEVFDATGFAEALSSHLSRSGKIAQVMGGLCHYVGRVRSHTHRRIAPFLLKERDLAYQKEFRIAMTPARAGPLEDFIVTVPELTAFCRLRE